MEPVISSHKNHGFWKLQKVLIEVLVGGYCSSYYKSQEHRTSRSCEIIRKTEKQLLNECVRSINNIIKLCSLQDDTCIEHLPKVLDDVPFRECQAFINRFREASWNDISFSSCFNHKLSSTNASTPTHLTSVMQKQHPLTYPHQPLIQPELGRSRTCVTKHSQRPRFLSRRKVHCGSGWSMSKTVPKVAEELRAEIIRVFKYDCHLKPNIIREEARALN